MSYEANLRVGIKATPEKIYEALTDTAGLAGWWTSDTRGSGKNVGDTLEFRFGKFSQKFDVKALEPGKLVHWKACKGGAEEWTPTEVIFSLKPGDGQTFVRFTHAGWADKTDFFAHCSTKWTVFLLSLRDLLEKGKGRPAPNDVPIE